MDRALEPRHVGISDDLALDKLLDDTADAHMHDQFRDDQQGQGCQEACMYCDIAQERHRHPPIPCQPLDGSRHQQRHPGQHDESGDAPADKLGGIVLQLGAPQQLKQRPARHQGKVAYVARATLGWVLEDDIHDQSFPCPRCATDCGVAKIV